MHRRPVAVGVAVGLVLAAIVLTLASRRPPAPPVRADGAVLSDCDGALDELVIHYVPAAAGIVGFVGKFDGHQTLPSSAEYSILTNRMRGEARQVTV